MCDTNNTHAYVLFDFACEKNDVYLKKGEELVVVQKANSDWWKVKRDGKVDSFYAPASYLKIAENEAARDGSNFDSINRSRQMPLISTFKSSKSSSSSLDDLDERCDSGSTGSIPLEVTTGLKGLGLSFSNPLCIDDNSDSNSAELLQRSFDEPEIDYSDDGEVNCVNENSSQYSESFSSGLSDTLEKRPTDCPIYANYPISSPVTPPFPSPDDQPLRHLTDHWAEYITDAGRKYYYNFQTGEHSWKPPRRKTVKAQPQASPSSQRKQTAPMTTTTTTTWKRPPPPPPIKKKNLKLGSSTARDSKDSQESLSPANSEPSTPTSPNFCTLPRGWKRFPGPDKNSVCFVHEVTNEKWYGTIDENGRTYYYDEKSKVSSWELPVITVSAEEKEKEPHVNNNESVKTVTEQFQLASTPQLRRLKPTPPPTLPTLAQQSGAFKARSVILSDDFRESLEMLKQAPDLESITRQGTLNKTELVKAGKKQKKSWTSAFVILTDRNLFLHKDINSAQVEPPGQNAELRINLPGAVIDWCPDKSKRKNVFQLSTIAGQKVLLQDDNVQTSKEWFDAIKSAIIRLPSGLDIQLKLKAEERESFKEAKKSKKVSRSKSIKCTRTTDSSADLTSLSPNERKNRIRDKLKQFFVRRPTLEVLKEKGIFKDEPIFGCQLSTLCSAEKSTIPRFVKECVEAIERKDMKADGLYRASGNLSQVQKIRCHVNQDDYSVLEAEEDVHVLTGALKMFFRHMKEPLFPFTLFHRFMVAMAQPSRVSRLSAFKELLGEMPKANFETLKFLLAHLLRVTEFSEQNRMHIQNLAIVFGPTLLSSAEESLNLALDMMHQNQIIEFLLLEYKNLFT